MSVIGFGRYLLASVFTTLISSPFELRKTLSEDAKYFEFLIFIRSSSSGLTYRDCPKALTEKTEKSDFNLNILKENFNYNLLELMKASPNTNFVLFFPPYSILKFERMSKHDNSLEDILKFKKYVFNETKELNNVTIFDFQTADNITHNLNNYKDLDHYSANINNWIIEQIMKNNYLVTSDNIDSNIQKLYNQAINYKFVN